MAGSSVVRAAALGLAGIVWAASVLVHAQAASTLPVTQTHTVLPAGSIFQASDRCIACHNGLTSTAGEDISIAADWRASMMANSSRDPYWQAAVRREVMDYPQAQAAIEDECSICHMPMTTFSRRAAGAKGTVFDRLPIGAEDDEQARLSADGVSCTVCHQMSAERLGDPATFTGGYVIDTRTADRRIFGRFAVDPGRTQVMRSSSGFTPTESAHIRQSEVCASCHTLATHALAAGAAPGTRLPEQMPYVEWQQSAFRTSASCQSCHMPPVAGEAAIASVLGQPRPDVARHTFRGGNFFMLRMLNRFRDDLGVVAPAREMDAAIQRTIAHLQTDTVRVAITRVARAGSRVDVDVQIENLAGHKFPTAYPSRRAWLQVTATDATGRVIFESGAFGVDGRIAGNDADADSARFEPHYSRIDRADQVQIYESVMADPAGRPTTGLLTAASYLKDNRLLPRGFAKRPINPQTAVTGAAMDDPDFASGGDLVSYSIDASSATGEVSVVVNLWFQPIAYRWAENLRAYKAPEPERFIRYWDAMAPSSGIVIAAARGTTSR